MTPEITFIIPTYNGKNCIGNAAAAILAEKEIPIELIIVDDGSERESAEACDAIAAGDTRVTVLHNENMGQGLARNYGIDAAKGEYLFFCDDDDTVVWEGIKQLLALTKEKPYDIGCGMYYCCEDGVTTRVGENLPCGTVKRNGTEAEQKLYHFIKTQSLFGYCTNKLYRRAFLKRYGLHFDDIRKVYMEDTLFSHKVFAKEPEFLFTNIPLFVYNYHSMSTTRRPVPDIAQRNSYMLSCYRQYLDENNAVRENMDLFVPLAMRVMCWSLFKNLDCEGFSAARMKERIRAFTENPAFADMLRDRKNLRELKKLPSPAQRIFFAYCFRTVSVAGGALLTATFAAAYPLMKVYVKKNIR